MLQKLSKRIEINAQLAKEPNLCDRFAAEDLYTIGQWCWNGYQRDKASRQKWETRSQAAMDLAMQIQLDKSFPWPGCSNVIFPLVSIAALQFSSRAYANIIHGSDVVKYQVLGSDPDAKLSERADRISRHMSWQVMEEDCGWEEQHDRLLLNLSIVGCNFVKSYFSSSLSYPVSELVMARDLVLDYWAKSVEECARKTQIIPMYRNEIYERVVSRTFRNVLTEEWYNSAPASPKDQQTQAPVDNRKGITPSQPDADSPFRFLEQHRLLDLDQDGYAEPYLVTIEESTQQVVKIAARWEREEDVDKTDFPGTKSKIRRIKSTEYFTKYGFIPSPDGGIYDVGYGILLGPLNEAVNSSINQIIDAGTQYNSNGGFLGRGVKIRGGVYTMAPWVWKRVDSSGDDLRKSMVPFPTKEPSSVMFQLLGLLIEYTDRLAGTTDTMVGVSPGQNTPAETSRNIQEQGMNASKSIYKRIWRSFKEEFKKRHQLNALYLPLKFRFGNSDTYVNQEDYRSNPDLVIPSADPDIISDSQRMTQAAAVREGAHQVPGYDVAYVEREIWLKALKVKGINKVYPGADKVPALPNPKAALEQLKLQGVKMKIDFEKQKFTAELMSQRNKIQAEVVKLYAEVGKLLAETQTEKVKAKIEAFNAIVAAFETHSDMMSKQIEAMSGGKEGESTGDKGGGVEGVASQPSNPGLPQVSSQSPGQSNGAMAG
jgi:chaperonin GroES